MTAAERVAAAVRSPGAVADAFRAQGGRVVWTLGWDIPRALIDAFGLHPVRLVPGDADRSRTDALVGQDAMGERGRALLAAIAALPTSDALLISHADAEQAQLFATLRELARCGELDLPPVHFLDLLTIDRPATRRYNRIRVEQAIAWLGGLTDAVPDFTRAITAHEALRVQLAEVLGLRASGQMSGAAAHRLLAAAEMLAMDDLAALLPELQADYGARAPVSAPRVLLSGSEIEDPAQIAAIEALGVSVVGEDHGWGAPRVARGLAGGDPLDALAAVTLSPRSGPFAEIAGRAAALAEQAGRLQPSRVLHVRFAGDDGSAWEVAALRRAVSGIPFASLTLPDNAGVAAFLRDGAPLPEAEVEPAPTQSAAPQPAARTPAPAPRSRKSLAAIARFGTYQREWFAEVRAAAAAGKPFAVVNANAPQEMLRALGIPFVVNQWWASIVAAKQQSKRYAGLLEAAGLPAQAEAYSSQGVAAAFDTDTALAPWGGLPRPDILGQVMTTDATAKLYQTWAQVTGGRLQSFHRSVESRWDIPIDWWDGLAEDWDHFIEPERLDLFEAELREAIVELETLGGTRFDPAAFAAIMDLVNEQEDHYRATRDLIARTVPAPISVVDQMPATMVPQWHRGTVWARDAAREFHDEVAQRVADGEGACPNERLRLMFVGRGVWGDMGFYQRWEESHGAVFVCSMYLSLASDGYIRRHSGGRDPLRALAARFVTMGDELRMPTWAGAWHVKEARLHQCDGAMALSDADPLVLRALREAGIPVLELGIDNYVRDPQAEADLDSRVGAFLDGPVAAMRATRPT